MGKLRSQLAGLVPGRHDERPGFVARRLQPGVQQIVAEMNADLGMGLGFQPEGPHEPPGQDGSPDGIATIEVRRVAPPPVHV